MDTTVANFPESRAKILIVDDHPTVREGLASRISRQRDLEVCGEADSEADALELALRLQPHLAIVDISLKKGHGLSLIKRLREQAAQVKILVHSMYAEALFAQRVLQAGAHGYVNKEADSDTVLEAIRKVLGGEIHLSSEMTQRLLSRTVGSRLADRDPVEGLSDRELEVLGLIGQGQTTREIARRLHLSENTIDTYRERIKVKLRLDNGAQLMRFAAQWVLENA
jgi:DNA-binding NarL/FixJ family response regulator